MSRHSSVSRSDLAGRVLGVEHHGEAFPVRARRPFLGSSRFCLQSRLVEGPLVVGCLRVTGRFKPAQSHRGEAQAALRAVPRVTGPGRRPLLIRGNPLERMTGIEPALSAWEAGEPTVRWCFQAQRWPFEGPVWRLFRRAGARGGPSS
jgi:hypothetical protein